MTRRKPLKRRTWMRQKRARPRRSGRVRDRGYLLAVKQLPCWLKGALRLRENACQGPIEADHQGRRPLGRKADDDTAVPMCRKHHRSRHDGTGNYHAMPAEMMRRWCDRAIAETRATLGRAA